MCSGEENGARSCNCGLEKAIPSPKAKWHIFQKIGGKSALNWNAPTASKPHEATKHHGVIGKYEKGALLFGS